MVAISIPRVEKSGHEVRGATAAGDGDSDGAEATKKAAAAARGCGRRR